MVEFFHMGGHYPYVWFSWGLTALVLGYCVWAPWHRRRRLLRLVADRRRQPLAAGVELQRETGDIHESNP